MAEEPRNCARRSNTGHENHGLGVYDSNCGLGSSLRRGHRLHRRFHCKHPVETRHVEFPTRYLSREISRGQETYLHSCQVT
jgi:hypothetical protein